VDESLVEWVVKCAKDPSFRCVFTASSSPNKDLPNGAQTLTAIADAAEARGVGWTKAAPGAGVGAQVGGVDVLLPNGDAVHAPGLELTQARIWSAGGAVLIDLGSAFSHEQHATKLARLLWSRLFVAQAGKAGEASPTATPPVAVATKGRSRGLLGAGLVLLASAATLTIAAVALGGPKATEPPEPS
jgi:hypothetical protein